ncbi:histidinol-phosphate transaminase [Pseudogymnoascus verrucosus]|uniref:histidinol-phosphate transaminase n=1 Tax=Pseudogymnoascus verrucosus TaxID=342668 RepID=A0A1B8G785_9PEZI|nr:histidinol-phosphate transaminase [Pseudogymnoascus verrucosus]OBT91682.1 histidinol-phosphate transaminase [Pseudogymnoascus verrucosus]
MTSSSSPFNLQTCARPNILALQPYRCARDDYKDDGTNILLDANENAFGPSLPPSLTSADLSLKTLNRYPDPHQGPLKTLLCDLRNASPPPNQIPTPAPLTAENLFLGVGSDEAIDALLRSFCVPGRDKILVCPPTYGMYTVSAHTNDVSLVSVPLLPAPTFGPDVPALSAALEADKTIKILYLCSPGNPTGSLIPPKDIVELLSHKTYNGIIVVDEAYIDFAPASSSAAPLVTAYPNLVVLQTLSKAFGLAGVRLGAAFAAKEVAGLMNALKAPYNISTPTSILASAALSKEGVAEMEASRSKIVEQRERLVAALPSIKGVGRLRGGEAANFLLFEILNQKGEPDNTVAKGVYERLAAGRGVVVRFRGTEFGCLGCLRVTVGTEEEVTRFLGEVGKVVEEVWGEVGA